MPVIESPAIDDTDIRSAARRLRGHTVVTPVVWSERLRRRLSVRVGLKAENLQRTGAFKARGAFNAAAALREQALEGGVVTHSSGNHAAALAWAAGEHAMPCWVVMPSNATAAKVANVRAHGVEPVFSGPTAAERLELAEALRDEKRARLVPPYNDPLVMAGQGTVGAEILEQVPTVDAIIVPVGGGGLLSGILTAAKARKPDIQVIAAEPAWADDAFRSLQVGSIQQPTRYDTIADGLRTPLGSLTFPIIRALLDEIVLVTEEAIREAVAWIREDTELASEPSGAVALAAAHQLRERLAGKTVVAVVSGGNIDG